MLHQIYPAGLPTATRALFARGAFRRMPTPEVCIAGSMLSAAIQPLRSRDLRRLKAVAVAHTNLEPWGPWTAWFFGSWILLQLKVMLFKPLNSNRQKRKDQSTYLFWWCQLLENNSKGGPCRGSTCTAKPSFQHRQRSHLRFWLFQSLFLFLLRQVRPCLLGAMTSRCIPLERQQSLRNIHVVDRHY